MVHQINIQVVPKCSVYMCLAYGSLYHRKSNVSRFHKEASLKVSKCFKVFHGGKVGLFKPKTLFDKGKEEVVHTQKSASFQKKLLYLMKTL